MTKYLAWFRPHWFQHQWLHDLQAMWGCDRRYLLQKRRDQLLLGIAWRLPKELVTWCFVRVVAHATTGPYGDTLVPHLTAMDALKRWDDDRRTDRRTDRKRPWA